MKYPGKTHAIAAAAAVASFGIATTALADLTEYTEDFESLDATFPFALSVAGWQAFGNVFDSTGAFKFGYGPFGAPNGGPGFSAIVDDQGGDDQGLQQLSVYNDYNCCGPGTTNEGHFNGTDLVESNVFQEQTIGAADLGDDWVFRFNAKRGDIAGSTTATAFIKVLDLVGGTFALLAFPTLDMTSIPDTWQGYEIPITIDPAWEGQLLQIGFLSVASNFEMSQIVYDNIDFSPAGAADSDGDGVTDDVDNCTLRANASQVDVDGDGIGNACDADIFPPGGGDCNVNFGDLSTLKSAFNPVNDPISDFNDDGLVNFGDLIFMKLTFFNGPEPGPGPGAPGNACE